MALGGEEGEGDGGLEEEGNGRDGSNGKSSSKIIKGGPAGGPAGTEISDRSEESQKEDQIFELRMALDL